MTKLEFIKKYEKKIQETEDQLQLLENLLSGYTKNKHYPDIDIELTENVRNFMSSLYEKQESYIQIIYNLKKIPIE